MNAFTQDQLDAIMDAQEGREDCASLPAMKVAELLQREGHPAWAGKPAPQAAAKPTEAAPRTAHARAPMINMPPPRSMPTATAAAPAPDPAPAPASTTAVATVDRRTYLPSAPIADGWEGGEALTMEDIKIPALKLQQNTSDGEASQVTPGHWFLASDPEAAEPQRSIVILDIAKWRELLFPYKKPREEAALREELERKYGMKVPADRSCACRSLDRAAPTDQGWGVVSTACGECPFAQWETIGGEKVPPRCGECYRVLVMDRGTGLPAFWRVRGAAIKPMKNLITLLVANRRRHPLFPGAEAPLCAFAVMLTAKEELKKGSKYWIPKATQSFLSDRDEFEMALGLRRALVGNPNVVEEGADDAAEAGEAA